MDLLPGGGAIAIAKRLEDGRNQVPAALASFPWSIQLLVEEYDQHTEGKKRLSEGLAGFAALEVPEAVTAAPGGTIQAAAAEADEPASSRQQAEASH